MKKPLRENNECRPFAADLLSKTEGRRFIRFLAVGLSNMAVSLTVYLGMLALQTQATGKASIAQAVSYGAGILWSYACNRKWVFRSSGRVIEEGARFVIAQVGLLLLSVAAIGVAVDWLGAHPLWAWILVMAGITILNFLLLRLWAFSAASG